MALGGLVAVAHADELDTFLKRSARKPAARASDAVAPSSPAAPAPSATSTLDDPPPSDVGAPTTPQAATPATAARSKPEPAPARPRPRDAEPPRASAATVRAAPSGPVGRPGDRRAILSLTVNLVAKGELFVIVRGHDVLALVSDLEDAGLHGLTGLREPIGGKVHVSMESLAAAGITFDYDERALALRVSAPAAGLGGTAIDLRQPRPVDVVAGDEGSGFINYTLRLQDFRHASAFAEGGATFKNGLLYSQVSARPDGHVVRGLTYATYAIPERTERFILGDTFASSGVLGGGLFLGGVSALRDFNLDPYFFRFPSSGLGGAVMTPSTVDVYVNGALVHRQELAPGPFQIDNLPLPVGASNARIVVRDAFGREQVVATPFYFSTGVLKAGVSDFGFHAGFRRNNMATESWDYAPAVFLGRYRFGLTDFLTPGGRLEGSRGLASGGPQATLRTAVGDVEGAAAVSYDGAVGGLGTGGGAAGSLSFTHLRDRLSAGALLRANTANYVNLALGADRDRALGQADVFAGTALGPRVSLTGRVGLARYRDAGDWSQLGLLGNVKLHEAASLFVTGTLTQAQTMLHPLYEVFASLTVALPDRTTATAFYTQANSDIGGGGEIQRPLPLGPGYGYRVRASEGTTTDLLAQALAQSAYGRYEATVERIGGHGTSLLAASGGLVTLGGNVFATRPVQQGFGVIQVPGVRGVRGYLNNQEIGRTDGDGNLLVPELIPYYANRLGIADEDLPLDFKIDGTERLVAPPLRGGTVAHFRAEKLQAVAGSIVMNVGGTDVNPSFGQMVVKRGLDELVSPLGRQGEFYFEGLPAGHYPAELDSAVGACKLELVVPEGRQADGHPFAPLFVDAGRVRCLGRAVPGVSGGVEPLPASPPERRLDDDPPATEPPGKARPHRKDAPTP